MKIGTKSVLYGAHCFLFHWFFVALGWFHLYGLRRVAIGDKMVQGRPTVGDIVNVTVPPSYRRVQMTGLWDPRLWLAFFLHDIGYIGKPNMDGDEGETHPELACRLMNRWFGAPWGQFCLFHSRFYAKKLDHPVSPLCYADKMAIVFTPTWLYLPFVRATGEIKEYMKLAEKMNDGAGGGKYASMQLSVADQHAWLWDVKAYVTKWVNEHKDGRADTWTPGGREAVTATGVFK